MQTIKHRPILIIAFLAIQQTTITALNFDWKESLITENEQSSKLDGIIILNNEIELKRAIKLYPYIVVEFSSTTCTYCQKFDPTYKSLAEKFDQEGLAVVFARIQAHLSERFVNTYDIESTPTLLFFHNGDGTQIGSSLEESEIHQEILSKLNGAVNKISKRSDIGPLKSAHGVFMVYFGSNVQNIKIFQTFTNLYGDVPHFYGDSKELLDYYKGEKIIMFKERDLHNQRREFDIFGVISPIDYAIWYEDNFFDFIMDLDNELVVNRMLLKEYSAVYLFYDPKNPASNLQKKVYEQSAIELLSEGYHYLKFIKGNTSSAITRNYLNMLNIQNQDFPQIIILVHTGVHKDALKRFMYGGNQTDKKVLKNWLQEFPNDTLEALPVSEEIPNYDLYDFETKNKNRLKIVTDNFDQVVYNNDMHVIVYYHIDDCEACNNVIFFGD